MSKDFMIRAQVDCVGVYYVTADSEEEAREKFANWGGDATVQFSHYAEVFPSSDIDSIEEIK